jgi:hypothetical protein
VTILIGAVLILGALAVWLYISYRAGRFIARHTGSKAIGFVCGLALLLLPIADDLTGRVQFTRLCSAEGGYVVSQAVETEGYFDGKTQTGCDFACKDALVKEGFRYVEIKVKEPRAPIREPGVYQFSLASGDSPACAEHNWYVSHQRGAFRGSVAMANDKCLVAVKVPAPTSRYEFVLAEWTSVSSPVRIERVSSHLKDRIKGESIGKSTSFVLFGGGWLVNSLSPHISGRSCPQEWTESHGPVQRALRARRAS